MMEPRRGLRFDDEYEDENENEWSGGTLESPLTWTLIPDP